jgi:hypothetical protein
MKRFVALNLLSSLCVVAALAQQSGTSGATVVHVATALNHLTVLEFHEPVTMAAAGSSAFQIERESNKVFVKPMKSGATTDLFVWTASRRFAYELETTQEVTTMNFAIDDAQPAPAPKPAVSIQTDQFADMMLTRALLGAENINQAGKRAAKNKVNVRIEQVFRTRTTVYLHYIIENDSRRPYRINTPEAYLLQTDAPSISVSSLVRTQLNQAVFEELGNTRELPLHVAHAESVSDVLQPGESTQGVVAIRQELKTPAVVQLVFDIEVKATVVL